MCDAESKNNLPTLWEFRTSVSTLS